MLLLAAASPAVTTKPKPQIQKISKESGNVLAYKSRALSRLNLHAPGNFPLILPIVSPE